MVSISQLWNGSIQGLINKKRDDHPIKFQELASMYYPVSGELFAGLDFQST